MTTQCHQKFAYNDKDIFKSMISETEKVVGILEPHSLKELNMWLDGNGRIESINLVFFNKNAKYKGIKAHLVLNKEFYAELEYIEYYKDWEYDSDVGSLSVEVIEKNYTETREKIENENKTNRYFVKMYYTGYAYIIYEGVYDDEYRRLRLDEKIDDVWCTSYDYKNNIQDRDRLFPQSYE